jgi:hypothetical protein
MLESRQKILLNVMRMRIYIPGVGMLLAVLIMNPASRVHFVNIPD